MSYLSAYALATNAAFLQRVAMSVASYANYILAGASALPPGEASQVRFNWAINSAVSAQGIASQIVWAVALDPNVVAAGVDAGGDSLIADSGGVSLDSAVQTVCNNLMQPAPASS